MTTWFAGGHVVDAIVGLMLLEAVALLWFNHRTRRGLKLDQILMNLGAGAALLMALRAALTGAGWPSLALWLLLALVAHLADLAGRLKVQGALQRPDRQSSPASSR